MSRPLQELWPLDRRGTHTLMALLTIFLSFCFVISLKAVFTPFFIALILAYIFNPFVTTAERFQIPRWCSAFLIFALFSLGLCFMLFVVVPSLRQEIILMTQGGELVRQLPAKISMGLKETAKSHLSPEIINYLRGLVMEWEEALRGSSNQIEEYAVAWGRLILMKVGTWTSWFLDFLLIPFYFFFILVGINRTWCFVEEKFIPYVYRDQILRIAHKVHLSLSSFFRGRLLICLIIGVMAWVGFFFFGVPFSFVLGFCIGFSTIVPLLGLVFLVPAMMCYGLVGANLEQQIAVMLFYSMLQGLEMFILSPFILGKEMELPPMVLVMSVLICGYLFGGIGVVLAVPIASTAKILMSEFVFPSFVELSKQETQSPRIIRRNRRRST